MLTCSAPAPSWTLYMLAWCRRVDLYGLISSTNLCRVI
jgi:hypothetical protein